MKHVNLYKISLLLIVLIPQKSFSFFGSLILLGPAIATAISTAQTRDYTKGVFKELQSSNLKLETMLMEMQKDPGKVRIERMFHSIYGKDKLSGTKWEYDDSGTTTQITEIDFTNQIDELKAQFTSAPEPATYNSGSITFNEELGDKGKQTIAKLKNETKTNNLSFEIAVFDHLSKLKTQLFNTPYKSSRFKEYAENIDEALTLKSSVDLNNLLALENLLQNKYSFEVQVYKDLIDIYRTLRHSNIQRNLANSLGELKSDFPITK